MKPSKKKTNEFIFFPDRFLGLIVLVSLFLLFLGISIFGFTFFPRQEPGPVFFLSFILTILFLVPVAFILYRCYGLLSSSYTLTRDRLQIKWGLRQEIIPLSEINWVHTPQEMPEEIPWPFLPIPGAYLGKVHTASGETIEFMASDIKKMIFVGTSKGVYGISPADPKEFLDGFQRVLQMGSVFEPTHQTIRPADWIAASWENYIARRSFVFSAVFLVLMFLWVGFRFSGLENSRISSTNETAFPIRNILILPFLAGVFWVIDMGIGVRLYKSDKLKRIAELIWSSGGIITFLFFIAGFIIK